MRKILFCLGIAVLLTACGKRGPLVPPEALAPSPISDLRLNQTGNRFELCLSPPSRDEAGRPLKDLVGFRVLKREVLPPAEDCEECPAAYREFRTVDMEYPKDVTRLGNLYCMFDTDLVTGKAYRYKAVSFLKDGMASRESNRAERKFVSPPAAPVLKGTSTPTGMALEWTAPPPPESGTSAGFNIYRGESAERMPPFPINASPVLETSYEDRSAVLGVRYVYAVRSVATVDGEAVESESSNKVAGGIEFPEE